MAVSEGVDRLEALRKNEVLAICHRHPAKQTSEEDTRYWTTTTQDSRTQDIKLKITKMHYF